MDRPLPSPPQQDTRRNVFQINDIDLVVPPTSIEVQQEDLLYNWRTLRSKAATKIATGHGQIRVHITVPFTSAMLLDLHRLIVQFRNSPFCYVKNRYLRESIVPDWPIYQSMAFTLTSLNVAPLPGSSDSWVCEMDLVWFNYKPYLHNYLFREDWNTNWLVMDNELEQNDKVKLSIGWSLDPSTFEKTPRPSTVAKQSNADNSGITHLNWSTLDSGYKFRDQATIFDMERLHFGESFDLLPLPGNMEPANFVTNPANSRIYTRYINYLQRDAMIKHFGFDPEESLGDRAPEYFSAVLTNAGLQTYGLHSRHVAEMTRNDWISRMLKHNGRVHFHFHAFKDVRLPTDWTAGAANSKQSALAKVFPPEPQGTVEFLQARDANGNPNKAPLEVRRGWWNPVGKVVPCGSGPTSTGPMTITEVKQRVTAQVSLRSAATDARLHGAAADPDKHIREGGTRYHQGTDIGVPVGTPLFATAPGIVTRVSRGGEGEGVRWKWWDTSPKDGARRGEVRNAPQSVIDDWAESITKAFGENTKVNKEQRGFYGPQVEPRALQSVGTFVRSIENPQVYYYADYTSGGQQLTINHDDGSQSKYMHVDEIFVSVGTRITAEELTTTVLGTVGRTSMFTSEFVDRVTRNLGTSSFQIDPQDPGWPDDVWPEERSPYTFKPHLHFEYWESPNISRPNNGSTSNSLGTTPTSGERVVVDPVPSWNAAEDPSRPDITRVTFRAQLDVGAEEQVEAGILSEEDADQMVAFLESMNADGWVYYGEESGVTNIWHKHIDVAVAGPQGPGPAFDNQTIVLANAAGGLRHVVASIPILSHEYPTQQHLGSIEPTYMIEFTVRDDSGDLKGISETAQTIQGMRNILQKNARQFRPIGDGWCMSTDTFITRLLGSFYHNDVVEIPISTIGFIGEPGLKEVELTKRTTVTRSSAGTAPGSPGVSFISLEVQETNPFDLENLKPTAIERVDLDSARKEVFQRLLSLDFIDQSQTQILALAVASQAGPEFLNPNSSEFGRVTIPALTSIERTRLALGYIDTPTIFADIPDYGSEENILIRDSAGFYEEVIDRIQKQGSDEDLSSFGPSADYAGYISIPRWVLPGVEQTTLPEQSESKLQTRTYDFRSLLVSEDLDSALSKDELKKVVDYYKIVVEAIRTAERLIVEHSSKGIGVSYDAEPNVGTTESAPVAEGLEDSVISDELFGVPFKAKMWRCWQEFLLSEAERQGGDSAAEALASSEGWLRWATSNDDQIDPVTLSEIREAAWNVNSIGNAQIPSLRQAVEALNFESVLQNLVLLGDDAESLRWQANNLLTTRYTAALPLETSMKILLDSYGYSSLFGSFLGQSEDNVPRAFENFSENLTQSVTNSGYFVPDKYTGSPVFQIEILDADSNPEIQTPVMWDAAQDVGNRFLNYWGLPPTDYYVGGSPRKVQEGWQFHPVAVYSPGALPAEVLGRVYENSPLIQVMAARLNSRIVTNPRFQWIVNQQTELEKVEHFKRVLARIADDILADAEMLEVLGLTGLADLTRRGSIIGSEAYPDIDLPFHPWFGDTLSVNPDFYIWNIYEDGGALGGEIQDQVKNSFEEVIDNCYLSMKRMQEGTRKDPTKNPLISEPAAIGQEQLDIRVKYNAEGTDTGDYGPMDTPFYSNALAKSGVDAFGSKVNAKSKDLKAAADQIAGGEETPKTAETPKGTGPLVDNAKLNSTQVDVRVAAAEGYFGKGGGVQYPRRLGFQDYVNLKDKIEPITQMFGTKLGYQNENLTLTSAPTLKARLAGTNLDRRDEYVHAFNPAELKQLALDSSKDIVSQKMTLRRAYPTFKLFFVEEDEFENRTLNFDDFFSYNGVQSFYVEMSRKSPADHAVITLQNVSGTLDGTKRGAVADLDYFSRDVEENISAKASSLSGDALNKDASLDQPIGSIVLRPGLNVQLRCGYSNDPDALHVMLSGRVIDVHWNKNGDLTEIMVQSFGTELVQTIKGTGRSGVGQVFYTTHQLLGSLMLEPEVVHFGRWEIGQLFQIGEASDYRLDFKDYSAENFMGRFSITSDAMQWAQDHPFKAMAIQTASLGLAAPVALVAADPLFEVGAEIFERIGDATVGRLKRFFTTKQVSLMLSPQDDNLFPPHPKDYMKMDRGWTEKITDWTLDKFASLVGRDSIAAAIGQTGFRWWQGGSLEAIIFDKKVIPADCQYQLVNTTTWRVFHEMSLRHPGWAYGPRPYGNELRYTMFFGVPSQRYWARGASNSFIKRANDLNKFLSSSQALNPEELEREYRALFGKDNSRNKTVEELKEEALMSAAQVIERPETDYRFVAEDSPEYKIHLHQALSGPAFKEYLRALNLRFVPFRRYHTFSSERDLVWNGLLSAENAVVNAVDVTYFNDETTAADANHSPVASALFKAHSFIPEYQLRIAPVRWLNCKSYNMAMRYGMGELLHRMKDMYRGEIIILGNPRVRPWDIGILMDSYNDMVGPIEVEQVVHSFSHETGFITEIKPSAVVFGNEISSWPILEAMKVFSLAVKDIEDNYISLREAEGVSNSETGTDASYIRDFADVFIGWDSDDMNDLFRERTEDLFAQGKNPSTPETRSLENTVFDNARPQSEIAQKLINSAEIALKSTLPLHNLGFGLGTKVADKIDFPGLAWLIGGPILFLQCLRQDSVIVVPVMKSGSPIVSGLSYHDPSMLWSTFRGDLKEFVDDVLDGTRDNIGEYKRFGTLIWNHVAVEDLKDLLNVNYDINNPRADSQRFADKEDMTGAVGVR